MRGTRDSHLVHVFAAPLHETKPTPAVPRTHLWPELLWRDAVDPDEDGDERHVRIREIVPAHDRPVAVVVVLVKHGREEIEVLADGGERLLALCAAQTGRLPGRKEMVHAALWEARRAQRYHNRQKGTREDLLEIVDEEGLQRLGTLREEGPCRVRYLQVLGDDGRV